MSRKLRALISKILSKLKTLILQILSKLILWIIVSSITTNHPHEAFKLFNFYHSSISINIWEIQTIEPSPSSHGICLFK